MEESAPATAAPPDAAAPESKSVGVPSDAEAAAGNKSRFRLRVPRALAVTLLGLAVSAWLLPAITRQWDERQKAHEVKTSLVTEMAGATAAALTDGRRLLFRPPTGGVYEASFAPPAAPMERWSKDSFRIEAKIRAYLPPRDAMLWHQYSILVESLLVATTGRGSFSSGLQSTTYYTKTSPENPRVRLPREVANGLIGFDRTLSDLGSWSSERYRVVRQVAKQRKAIEQMDPTLEGGWSSPSEKALIAGGDLEQRYARFAATLLRMEEQVANRVLNAHVRGYSTTWRDFVSDVVP